MIVRRDVNLIRNASTQNVFRKDAPPTAMTMVFVGQGYANVFQDSLETLVNLTDAVESVNTGFAISTSVFHNQDTREPTLISQYVQINALSEVFVDIMELVSALEGIKASTAQNLFANLNVALMGSAVPEVAVNARKGGRVLHVMNVRAHQSIALGMETVACLQMDRRSAYAMKNGQVQIVMNLLAQ